VQSADGFDNTVAVDDNVTLQWNIVSIEGALYMQARQTLKAVGWTGWALSRGELIHHCLHLCTLCVAFSCTADVTSWLCTRTHCKQMAS
jgi:hypothetical protein